MSGISSRETEDGPHFDDDGRSERFGYAMRGRKTQRGDWGRAATVGRDMHCFRTSPLGRLEKASEKLCAKLARHALLIVNSFNTFIYRSHDDKHCGHGTTSGLRPHSQLLTKPTN